MTILVTGRTGTAGQKVTEHLVDRGADIRALTKHPDDADRPDGVRVVGGDLNDVESLRRALVRLLDER